MGGRGPEDFAGDELQVINTGIQQILSNDLDEIDKLLASKDFNLGALQKVEKDLIRVVEIVKLLEEQKINFPEIKNKLNQIFNNIGSKYIESFDRYHNSLEKGSNEIIGIEKNLYHQLQNFLLVLRNLAPSEMDKVIKNVKNKIVDRVSHLTKAQIDIIRRYSKYGQIEQKVVTSIPMLTSFLDIENPTVEDFTGCFDFLFHHVYVYKDSLMSKASEDLVLDAYVTAGRSLIESAASRIQSTLSNMGINLNNPKNREIRSKLERVLNRVPPIFGSTISLIIEIEISRDQLLAFILSTLSEIENYSISSEHIMSWITAHPDYDLENFENWLVEKQGQPIRGLGPTTGCEELYTLYISEKG